MEFKHKPVMLDECINGLNIKPDGIYVDGTLGGAGHSKQIVKKIKWKWNINRNRQGWRSTKSCKRKFKRFSKCNLCS